MATITARVNIDGNPRYRVEVRLSGFPRQSRTFRTRKAAKAWAIETEAMLLQQRDAKTGQPIRTVAQLLDRYIAEVLPLKPKARNQKQQLLWFRQQIGGIALAEISTADLKRCQTMLRFEYVGTDLKHQRSNATVNRYMAALSHAFTVATDEWQWLNASPMERLTRLKEPTGRVRYLSHDDQSSDEQSPGELTRLLDTCRQSPQPALYPIVVLALSTGLRLGEIRALRWADINFKEHQILIRQSKNGHARCVPLVDLALTSLQDWWNRKAAPDDSLVFPSAADATVAINITIAWRQAVRTAGIQDFRFHDLRHTAASYLAMSGATHIDIATILGHRTLAMVKRYSHLSPSHTNDVVARMNRGLFS